MLGLYWSQHSRVAGEGSYHSVWATRVSTSNGRADGQSGRSYPAHRSMVGRSYSKADDSGSDVHIFSTGLVKHPADAADNRSGASRSPNRSYWGTRLRA